VETAAAQRLEERLTDALSVTGLRRERGHDHGFDLATEDLSLVVELKVSIRTAPRDVIAAATQLAVAVQRHGARRGVLAWWASTFSPPAIERAWNDLAAVLAPDVAVRLQLLVISPAAELLLPADSTGAHIASAMRSVVTQTDGARPAGRTDRTYDVLKLLLVRWLRDEPPISMGELQRLSGLSHPTVAQRVRELGSSVERTSSRGVRLKELPVRAWSELLARSPRVRQTTCFEDRSGRTDDLARMIARLRRHKPAHVAIGGVAAARYWQPTFDLVGVPRVDLEVHAPLGLPDLRFVQRLDPALVIARPEAAPALAVHVVTRAESLFEPDEGGLAWADPVETLLDLHQLRLHKQADEFVRYWRRRR
jgi:hypothetical protein